MWKIPVSLIAGLSEGSTTITEDTLIGNLWLFLGSPSGPQEITLRVDGADVGDVQITADWDSGSTFQITCINGGRVLGLGGNGGKGGDDNGATGTPGSTGLTGNAALSSNGFVVNVDIDDGYLMGGGGGGGGAPYDDTGAGGDSGGGGGGGAGFSVTSGGDAGSSMGIPESEDGDDGGPSGAGMGGISGGAGTRDSGDGGEFGLGGNVADSESKAYYGGAGGDAGQAFAPTNGGTIVYNGVKIEATLISEARLIGQTSEGFASMVQIRYNNGGFGGGSQQVGWTFSSVGLLTFNSSATNDTNYQDSWYGGPQSASAVGADYEVRVISGHTYDNAFTTVPVAEGSWIALGSDRTWELSGSVVTNQSLFQIRAVGGTEILASGHLNCTVV